jgi:antitoxin MazE7
MAAETATIRVTRETRDVLAHQASERGVSLSAMLADLAHDIAREAAFRAERDATRADAGLAAAKAEDREWEAALDDGVD